MPDKYCQQTHFPDRCDIQQDIRADGDNQENFSGPPFKTNIPGLIISTGGDEEFRGRKIEPTITHVFQCRYFPGVVSTMRLKITNGIYKDRILNIEFANIIRKTGAAPMYELRCKELAAT